MAQLRERREARSRARARARAESSWDSLRQCLGDLTRPAAPLPFLEAVRGWYLDNAADLKEHVIENLGEPDTVFQPLSISWLVALDYADLPLEANGMTAQDYLDAVENRPAPKNEAGMLRFLQDVLLNLTVRRTEDFRDHLKGEVFLLVDYDTGNVVLFASTTGDTYRANGIRWRGDITRLVPISRGHLLDYEQTRTKQDPGWLI